MHHTTRGVARVRHMGPRPQPQRLCPLKFHKLALGAATLSRNCRTLKIGLATPLHTTREHFVSAQVHTFSYYRVIQKFCNKFC